MPAVVNHIDNSNNNDEDNIDNMHRTNDVSIGSIPNDLELDAKMLQGEHWQERSTNKFKLKSLGKAS